MNGSSNAACEIASRHGVVRLVSGTRQARFNDLTLWLGYAPAAANGQLWLNETDAEKNVVPLLRGEPALQTIGTVVIDPGHGGENTGTRSPAGDLEKNLTLDWALRLGPLLRQRGWSVVLTRSRDVDVSLEQRVAIADAAKADVFISLHFNSSLPDTRQQGVETYCLTPQGLPSTITRDYEDAVERAYPNNSHDAANLLYAYRLHRSLVTKTGAQDRGIRRARFMGVLRPQNRPAVLIEAGYLSHPAEAARIQSPGYRQLLAEAVVAALVEAPQLARGSTGQRSAP